MKRRILKSVMPGRKAGRVTPKPPEPSKPPELPEPPDDQWWLDDDFEETQRFLDMDHHTPTLRFTPYAWAKLLWFRDHSPKNRQTEIGGFGLTAEDDPLLVVDLLIVKQQVSAVTVRFDDAAVADLFDDQVDQGRRPDQFARIWLHSHPGDSAEPSGVDEETFARVFGSCDWAVMAILAKGGQTYARLRFNVGPGGELLIPMIVDYSYPFAGSDEAAWQTDYEQHITPIPDGIMDDDDLLALPAPAWVDPVHGVDDEDDVFGLDLDEEALFTATMDEDRAAFDAAWFALLKEEQEIE